jgi:signal transduction histidine kinase
MELRLERFDFSQLAHETSDTVRALIGKKEQHLVLDIEANLPELLADRVRMKQVLLNLLSNAHKFTQLRIPASALRRKISPVFFRSFIKLTTR